GVLQLIAVRFGALRENRSPSGIDRTLIRRRTALLSLDPHQPGDEKAVAAEMVGKDSHHAGGDGSLLDHRGGKEVLQPFVQDKLGMVLEESADLFLVFPRLQRTGA